MTSSEQEAGDVARRTKGRSPSYPGVALRTAVERARIVYDKEGRHRAPMSAITGHWGYRSPTTGPASVTYSALRKFGLLTDEGNGRDRRGQLTTLALAILMSPDPEEVSKSLRTAALLPPIHREMWETYADNLPSDETLRYRLVVQGNFTETGYQEFIREYRDTIAFAQLSSTDEQVRENDALGSVDDSAGESKQHGDKPRNPPDHGDGSGVSGNVLSIPVPVIGGKPITVQGEFPISEAAWNQFLAVLAAMKPGLVAGDPDDGSAN